MPVTRQYIVGQGVILSATFKNPAGVPTDPTTITLWTKAANAEPVDRVYGVDPDVTKKGDGAYEYDLLLDTPGELKYRWIGTGAVAATADSLILVWAPLV